MTKATNEFQNLLAVKPFMPKKSIRIIKEFVERYKLDELDDTDISLDFIIGFSYAIGIIEAMLEVERDRGSTDKIVAWMPKPEPYKGESEEQNERKTES